ncbi:MAG: hypothetical protein M1451_10495, partial [Acidobacteria bacterium]|nr:hypothetical protein [Acidobacteriota bacterium]
MRRAILAAGVAAVCALSYAGQMPPAATSFIPYSDARPILEAFGNEAPEGLGRKSAEELEAQWPQWVAGRDAAIRARLEQGDWDTLVHWMMFGTSFTKRVRLTPENIQNLEPPATAAASPGATAAVEMLRGRMEDLVDALSAKAPTQNERILFARRMLTKKGFQLEQAAGREAAREFLRGQLARMLREQAGYAETLDAARRLGNATEEFAARSTLYRERGLSLDTSLSPNLAVERSLAELQRRGLLARGSVRRVAIVGPGLDFTDKQSGFDFYPQQSVQPFAVMDALLRLGLAN